MTRLVGIVSLLALMAATPVFAGEMTGKPEAQPVQPQSAPVFIQSGPATSGTLQQAGQSGQTVTITCLGHQPGGPMTCTHQNNADHVDVRRLAAAGIILPPSGDKGFVSVACCQSGDVQLPTSFFMGAFNNGVGYNTQISYTYGAGGYAFVGGGTRFSGVRERSPTPLVPPNRPHRPPPPKPCGCH